MRKKEPAYLKVYEKIKKEIVEGIYEIGVKLPSKRVLSEAMGVSIITIEHAYSLLCEEGYVESKERSGYFVIFKKEDGFAYSGEGLKSEFGYRGKNRDKGFRNKGENIGEESTYKKENIEEGLGNKGKSIEDEFTYRGENIEEGFGDREESLKGEFIYTGKNFKDEYYREERKEEEEIKFPVSVMAKTMRAILSDLQEKIFLSSPPKGCLELREEIRRYLERNQEIRVQTEQIIIGAGAEYLYHLIPDLLGKDKIYGIETPSYEKIEQSYKNQGVEIERIPMTREGMDSNYLKNSKADILHISPYRSYPTGVTATASKKYEYIRWAKKQDGFLVEDDFESEFSLLKKKEETLFSLSEGKQVIYMNTFSKTISSSLRIGYMVLPKELLETYDKVLGYCSCPVPTYMQLVVARLIENGDFERHINRIRRKKRKQLQSSLLSQ